MSLTPEFDIYLLNQYKEQLIQLDYEIRTLTIIAKQAINKETNISSKTILDEGLRLLNEIDILREIFHLQYLKITN